MKYKVEITEIEDECKEGERYPAQRTVYTQTVHDLEVRQVIAVVNQLENRNHADPLAIARVYKAATIEAGGVL